MAQERTNEVENALECIDLRRYASPTSDARG